MENTPVATPTPSKFGSYLATARYRAGITQAQLAKRLGVTRSVIARIEVGLVEPDFALAVRLATALHVSLEWFSSGRLRPAEGLAGLAVELHHLGIRDLRVSRAKAPGSFRRPEEVLALVLSDPEPEARVIDAMPYVLVNTPIQLRLLEAFARGHLGAVRRRFGWLCQVVRLLHQTGRVHGHDSAVGYLKCVHNSLNVARPAKTEPLDSLGLPCDNPPLVWRQWRINYAGTLDDFAARAAELHALAPGPHP